MNRLKELRKQRQLTQEDLAKKLNVAPSLISGYESEARGMSVSMMSKICEIFDCSIDYLLCRTETRNIKEVNFANAGGLDTHGLTIEDLMELQRQADYMRKIKGIK